MIGRARQAAGGQYSDGGQAAGPGLRYGEAWNQQDPRQAPVRFRGCSVYKLRNPGAVPEKFVG